MAAMSASDQAYRQVKEMILDGRIASGEMITEGQIVEMMSVSRTPIREAFLRLAAEGWLRLYPKRGALVIPVQPEEMEQVLEARHLIETHAMRTITEKPARAAQLADQLMENIAQMRNAFDSGDVETFTTLDPEFHLLIVCSAGNDVLSDVFRGLRDRLRRMTTRSVWQNEDRMAGIIHDHTELAGIVRAADLDAYSRRLMTHMLSVHNKQRGLKAYAPIERVLS